jgi:acetyl esterase
MALDWRVRLLDSYRRRSGLAAADLDLEGIQAARQARLPQVPVGQPVVDALGRAIFGTPRTRVSREEIEVAGADGALPAIVWRPPVLAASQPVLLHLHGGGWVVGSPETYGWICTSVAEDVGAIVVSVDYRKAPEHPAPAAADDARAAYDWLVAHRGDLGLPTDAPIGVFGDSAGGNLATLVAIHARDTGQPLEVQGLIYPCVDLTLSFDSVTRLPDEPILTRRDMDAFVGHYLDASDLAADDPGISPWFVEDVRGLAPAVVQTASHDPLVDEGDAWARRLIDAGVEVRHTRYLDVPHGFLSLPGINPPARQALAELTGFLRHHLVDRQL